jgi:hypothetical protein
MAVTIATLLLIFIVLFCAYLSKLTLFKIKVRPEFDSQAVDILAQRRFVKHNSDLSDREKSIELIVLEQKGENLIDTVIKNNGGKNSHPSVN